MHGAAPFVVYPVWPLGAGLGSDMRPSICGRIRNSFAFEPTFRRAVVIHPGGSPALSEIPYTPRSSSREGAS